MSQTLALAYVDRCLSRGEPARLDDEFADPADRALPAQGLRDVVLARLVAQDAGQARLRGVHVHGAIIVGTLDFSGCGTIHSPLPNLWFEACVFHHDKADETCNINVSGACVTGLKLIDNRLTSLRGIGLRVTMSLELRAIRGIERSPGELCWMTLSSSHVAGDFIATNLRLRAPPLPVTQDHQLYDAIEEKWALNLKSVQVLGSVFIRHSSIHGGILMDDCQLGRDLLIHKTRVCRRGENPALALSNARLGGSLCMTGDGLASRSSLHCHGTIWLFRASIAASMDIMGARLSGGRRNIALYAVEASVGGWVQLGGENSSAWLQCQGRLWLQGAKVGGDLHVVGVRVRSCGELEQVFRWREVRGPMALDAHGVQVGAVLKLASNLFDAGVELSGARCAVLADEQSGYGRQQAPFIDGLRYERIEDGSGIDRLHHWLPTGPAYRPQPYAQLAGVLAAHGQDALARRVLTRKARADAWQNWWLPPPQRLGARQWRPRMSGVLLSRRAVYGLVRLYGLAFDFGLSPSRAFATLVLFIAAGAVWFQGLNDMGAMTANSSAKGTAASVLIAAARPGVSRAGDPLPPRCGDDIRSPIYAADVFIPLIDLREEAKCDVDAARGYVGSASAITVYRFAKAAYAVLGWIVTTLCVLTFSGVLRHGLARD